MTGSSKPRHINDVRLVVKSLGYGSVGSAAYGKRWSAFGGAVPEAKPAKHVLYSSTAILGSVYLAGWMRTQGVGNAFESMNDAKVRELLAY